MFWNVLTAVLFLSVPPLDVCMTNVLLLWLEGKFECRTTCFAYKIYENSVSSSNSHYKGSYIEKCSMPWTYLSIAISSFTSPPSHSCVSVLCYLRSLQWRIWGRVIAQLVEVLRYKSGGRGFDSRRCQFFIDNILPAAVWTWYQLSLWQKRVKAAGACVWQPYHFHVPIVLKSGSLNLLEPSEPAQACNGIALPLQWWIWTWRGVVFFW